MIGVTAPAPGLAGRRLGGKGVVIVSICVELEEMSLSRGFHQPFPPRAKDVAAVELQLMTQLFDGCSCSWTA